MCLFGKVNFKRVFVKVGPSNTWAKDGSVPGVVVQIQNTNKIPNV